MINDLITPCLLLDRNRLERNVDSIAKRAKWLGVALRPHVKTAKCIDIANMMRIRGMEGICVSTLKETEQFAQAGFDDIIYAVGVTPDKALALQSIGAACGASISAICDSVEGVRFAAAVLDPQKPPLALWIEIDVDGARGGVRPEDPILIACAKAVRDTPMLSLQGVLTHAGGSYACRTIDDIKAMAEAERAGAVAAAARLRGSGFGDIRVSIGSTPTLAFSANAYGVDEYRAGVFVFYDLMMAELGVCSREDIALSVLATVIGHQRKRGVILVDAGALALSKDAGGASGSYGEVRFSSGRAPKRFYHVARIYQEHGLIVAGDGAPPEYDLFPIGAKVRILPNHACMTAAAYSEYIVHDNGETVDRWPRFSGW